MSAERQPITTVAQLQELDEDEIVEGFLDAYAGEPEPGDNRSLAYWHGWRNGANDRAGKVNAAQRALARELFSPAPASPSELIRG